MPASDEDIFSSLIQQLRTEGHADAAARLHTLRYEMAWTTGSELLGELGLAIRDFLRTRPKMSPELRGRVKAAQRRLNCVWPL